VVSPDAITEYHRGVKKVSKWAIKALYSSVKVVQKKVKRRRGDS